MKHAILLTAVCGISLTSLAWDSAENKIWMEGAVTGKLCDSVSLKVAEQVRYTGDSFDYVYRHSEACLKWKFAKGWCAAPAFRYVTATKKGVTTSTPAWHLNLSNTSSFWGMDLQTRARVFYSDLDGVGDLTDFRPKFWLKPSKGWTSWKLKPFIADELMINLGEGRFYLNRLSAGLTLSPLKNLSICPFIAQDRIENKTQTEWNERYNYGITACLKF